MKNWPGILTFTPNRVVLAWPTQVPKLPGFDCLWVSELSGLVQGAEGQGKTVRAVGSLWSYTDCAVSLDTVVDFANLNRVLGFSQGSKVWRDSSPVLVQALTSTITGGSRRLAHVEAGITVNQLYKALDDVLPDALSPSGPRGRWCVPVAGASSGQRLIGAVSTATHGGAFNDRPLADVVRAIHLIGPGGRHHWFERNSDRLTTETALVAAMPELAGGGVHYDDDAFNAVVVSMGAMGLVVDYIVEVAAQIGISQRIKDTTWHTVRAKLVDGSLFGSAPPLGIEHPEVNGNQPPSHSLEILINPFRISNNYQPGADDDRPVRLVHRAAAANVNNPPTEGSGGSLLIFPVLLDPVTGVILGAAAVTSLVIALESGDTLLYREIVNQIFSATRSEIDDFLAANVALDTYDGTGFKAPGMSMEIAIPTSGDRHVALLDALLEEFDDLIRDGRNYAGFFSVRFTRASRALLAMQQQPTITLLPPLPPIVPMICHIEVFGLNEIKMVPNPFPPGSFSIDIVASGNMEGWTDQFFRSFEVVARGHGARFHWGQLAKHNRQRVDVAYARTLYAWRKEKTLLCRDGSAATFSNPFTRRTGLESFTEVVAGTAVPGANRSTFFRLRDDGTLLFSDFTPSPSPFATVPLFFLGVPYKPLWAGPLTATATSDGVTHVFGQIASDHVVWVRRTGNSFSHLILDLDDKEQITSNLVAVVRNNAVHLVALDRNGNLLLWVNTSGNSWTLEKSPTPFPDGAEFGATITAAVDPEGRLHVFGIGTKHQLIWASRQTDGVWWFFSPVVLPFQGFPPLPPFFTAPPTMALNTATSTLDFFAAGEAKVLYVRRNVGGNVWNWEHLNLLVPTPPKTQVDQVTGSGDDLYLGYGVQFDVFAYFVGPLAVTIRSGRIDIVGKSDDGTFLHAFRPSGGSFSTVSLGANP